MDQQDANPDSNPEPDLKRHLKLWPARCCSRTKLVMISTLLLCFIAQTYLVYADPTPTITLSPTALKGRATWLANNCQSCHQVHGFGGFLGPDLTNATQRIDYLQLQIQLATGSAQMPQYEFTQQQTDELWAYLESLNETGTGQARNPKLDQSQPAPAQQALAALIIESGDQQVARGYQTFTASNCTSCHAFFADSAVGAPDLSTSLTRNTPDDLNHVLEQGRPPRMPPTPFLPAQQADVHAFITFMNTHRAQALENAADFDDQASDPPLWKTLPWWEY